ncbi:hypothetical protein NQ317_005371 [Molorchus minor]|uniref:Uncharacterized protein n=1 Tax=Molorchus minor TaxID=1323400 RepID=A0ABQ9J5F4_9CUCU|nr:hypothetical protein NQ317_005371 [Molorchus minor]
MYVRKRLHSSIEGVENVRKPLVLKFSILANSEQVHTALHKNKYRVNGCEIWCTCNLKSDLALTYSTHREIKSSEKFHAQGHNLAYDDPTPNTPCCQISHLVRRHAPDEIIRGARFDVPVESPFMVVYMTLVINYCGYEVFNFCEKTFAGLKKWAEQHRCRLIRLIVEIIIPVGYVYYKDFKKYKCFLSFTQLKCTARAVLLQVRHLKNFLLFQLRECPNFYSNDI